MPESAHKALAAATLCLLRPLVRILLRHGLSYASFADIAKWAFVAVATEDFGLAGRKQSVSRVAVLTGLSRKEVRRLQRLPRPGAGGFVERHNRAARVLDGWLRDAAFCGADGPRDLPVDAGSPSFAELVQRYSGDVPTRAVLDELERLGAVTRLADGRLRLLARSLVPQCGAIEALRSLGTDTAALIQTIEHNLDPARGPPLFQHYLAHDDLPEEALPAVRALVAHDARALLLKLEQWLACQGRSPGPGTRGRRRAGLGIYYFERSRPEDD